ncbi:MAG: cadherin repeat domain-containing protein [Pirellulaceae bacterium]
MIAGDGDADNAQFQIIGNELKTAAAFNFESQSSYTIRVQSTDAGGLSTSAMFTINVQDVNEVPTTVDLSNSVVDERQDIGTVVGTLQPRIQMPTMASRMP